jgi:hypothetical protein
VNATTGYFTANYIATFIYNATAEKYQLLGSQDNADADTTSITNVYETPASSYLVHNPTVGSTTTMYYPFVGVCDDGTLEKITATTSATAA